MPAPRSFCDWPAARADLADLEAAREPHAAAAAYVARWPQHPPDYFTDRSRDHARRAFDHGEGWAARLLTCLETPAHFSLHAEHLDLDPSAAAPHLLFDRANVRRWKAAILHQFRGPCRWRLELGKGGRVHCHVLADLADSPAELPRSGEIVKPCAAYWTAAVRYQLKPALEYTPEHLAIWLEAKKCGRLPRLAGSHGIPQKRTWGHPSKLRDYFAFATSADPQTAPVGTPVTTEPPPSAATQTATAATAATRATTAPKTTSRHRSAPLSHHRAPSTSARTLAISKPLGKTYVGELASRPLNTFRCEVGHPRERGPPDRRPPATLDPHRKEPP